MNKFANVSYVDSRGNNFDLMVDDVRRITSANFHKYEWGKDATEKRFGEKLRGWKKSSPEYEVIILFTGSEDDRANMLNTFHDALEYDIKNASPGRLIWEGYYIECYGVSSVTEPAQDYANATANQITFYCPYPWWKKESEYVVFDPTSELIEAYIRQSAVPYSSEWLSLTSGSGSDPQYWQAFKTLQTASYSIEFSNLGGEPTTFIVVSRSTISTGSSPYKIATVLYDGTKTVGQYITNTSNSQVTYDNSGYSFTYNNGTLTITATNAQFGAFNYALVYTFGGSSDGVHTSDVQVGSGATSITFNGLEEEPIWWACTFKSNFGTSSGYQRVIAVIKADDEGSDILFGLEMDSSAKYSYSHWTSSYSNGSFTITSQGANAGGYYHQPGYYQLTYVIHGSSGDGDPLTPVEGNKYKILSAGDYYGDLYQWFEPAYELIFSGQDKDYEDNYDYMHDYAAPSYYKKSIINDNTLGSKWILQIEGPVNGPYIQFYNDEDVLTTIYFPFVEVPEGSVLVVNSSNKTAIMYMDDGTTINCFGARDPNYYLWDELPYGKVNAVWDGSFKFAISLIEERSEPKWPTD